MTLDDLSHCYWDVWGIGPTCAYLILLVDTPPKCHVVLLVPVIPQNTHAPRAQNIQVWYIYIYIHIWIDKITKNIRKYWWIFEHIRSMREYPPLSEKIRSDQSIWGQFKKHHTTSEHIRKYRKWQTMIIRKYQNISELNSEQYENISENEISY